VTAAVRIERILASLPDPADRAALISIMPPWMRRRQRVSDRNRAIQHLATFYRCSSGREIASRIRADLGRVLSRGWRDCDSAHMSALRRVLALCDSRIPGDRTIRAALAGLGQFSPEAVAHGMGDTDPRPGAAGPAPSSGRTDVTDSAPPLPAAQGRNLR
jgi:hypothetical protein